MRVIVTGANGFVGRAVCTDLARRGHHVVACVRQKPVSVFDRLNGVETAVTGPLEDASGLASVIKNADTVVHTAGWTGSGRPTPGYAEAVNVRATAHLADFAARHGVGHFVFLSSAKAIAGCTNGTPLTALTLAAPVDAYGRSKRDAERALLATSGLPVTILRPPLLYGPGVKGSMRALFKLAASGVPLPLASIDNARDLLAVDSLADLIGLCVDAPPRDKRILMACDGERVSSRELYIRISAALGRPARVFAFPPAGLRALGSLSGRMALVDSLMSSMEIDDMETRRELGWKPSRDMRSALEATALWFREVHEDGPAGA